MGKFLIALSAVMAGVSLIWLIAATGEKQTAELEMLRGEITLVEYRAVVHSMSNPIFLLALANIPLIGGLILVLKED